MKRRTFLRTALSAAALGALGESVPRVVFAAAPSVANHGANYRNLLVLIELKGGNDGLNTLVPYTDAAYYALRPKIAIARDTVVQLSDRAGLHPSLAPLLPLWKERQLAVLQGVGYADPNLSHFRSIEIWDTASKPDEYLTEGWLSRTFAAAPVPRAFAADGVIIGSNDLGPLAGAGTRAVALANTEQFLRRARLASPAGASRNKALEHILKVEADIVQAAAHLDARYAFTTEFPGTGFGNAIKTASQVIANPGGVAVVRVTLSGFDTHGGQPATQARLLAEVAQGIVALKSALDELGSLERHAGADVRRVRPAPEGEPVERHRPRHRERPFRARRTGRRRILRRGAIARPARRRRQHGIRTRLPQCVCDGARALVEHALVRGAGRQVRAGRVRQGVTRIRTPAIAARYPAFASHAATNSRQCGASIPAIFSRASETSFAYSPAVSSPRSRRNRR